MKQIKVSEATPLQLNWLVAKCEGLECEVPAYADTPWVRVTDTSGLQYVCPDYSTDWAHGGPIIERMFAQGLRLHTAEYTTGIHDKTVMVASLDSPNGFWFGPTPLIAAMRCFVASRLGQEAEVPDELA